MSQVPAAMRTFLGSKIHQARVTAAGLACVGSITTDSDWMERADIEAKNRFVRDL